MNIDFDLLKANTKLPIPFFDENGKKIGVITSLSEEEGLLKGQAIMHPGIEIKMTLAVKEEFETTGEAKVRRTLLHNQYQEASQQIIPQLTVDNLEQIKTEDDILEAAQD